jgi:F-type H+-transporting ATPase subunit a
VPWPVYVLLTPIEFLTVFLIRPATLAIRLLANMMAGHVLLTIFFLFTHDFLWDGIDLIGVPIGILTFALSCILILFELLVILIQAYIFTTLSAFYIAESLHGHGHDEEHAATDEYKEPSTDQYETEGLKAPTAA